MVEADEKDALAGETVDATTVSRQVKALASFIELRLPASPCGRRPHK
ncbi:MAG: hypothetical protein FJ098_17010 [Deltaproteobacteria bacterium]|nr:hypothetical protein [Deltaproteobacteria bacterium]